jgi:hypothetical protein
LIWAAFTAGLGDHWRLTWDEEVVDADAHRAVHRVAADLGRRDQRTSLDSLLGVGCPPRGRAVSTMENSCRTSLLDV